MGVGVRLYLETAQNIDVGAARAMGAGVSLDTERDDTSWGCRAFEATDPSGFKVTSASQG
jgi:uncharacterized glyoxalase superfamily protein PhnB